MSRNIGWLGIAAALLFFWLPPGPAAAQQSHDLIACFSWCDARSQCKACSSLSGCGSYYTPIVDFSYRWFACRPRNSRNGRRSENNRRACVSYCAGNRDCDFCSTYSHCGSRYRQMRSFTGGGRNWYACQDDISDSAGTDRLWRLRHGREIGSGTISFPGW